MSNVRTFNVTVCVRGDTGISDRQIIASINNLLRSQLQLESAIDDLDGSIADADANGRPTTSALRWVLNEAFAGIHHFELQAAPELAIGQIPGGMRVSISGTSPSEAGLGGFKPNISSSGYDPRKGKYGNFDPTLARTGNYAIEFRSGSYFRSLEDEHGTTLPNASRFETCEEAAALMEHNQWMLFAGGMVVSIEGDPPRRIPFDPGERQVIPKTAVPTEPKKTPKKARKR